MKVSIGPGAIGGTILAPASKSAMQRACALALLQTGETVINNPGKSNDDLAAIAIIEKLGASIEREEDKLIVNSNGLLNSSGLQAGESGLGLRMFAPIAALSPEEIIINGEGSLLNRPMDFFDEVFPQLEVSIHSNNGKLPIRIKGPLQPKDISIDGSLSSQFLTGLLMAFAKAAKKQVIITVTNLKSKPYIDLTLQMMKYFGYEVAHELYEKFIIKPSAAIYQPRNFTVEGDWSGAAFLLVAGAITGDVTVKGLDVSSTQADRAVLQALMMTGAGVSITEDAITVRPPLRDRGKAFHFDATDCPDLFPPLVALAAHCEGISVIKGAGRLAHKESDRALALMQEFKKMGVEVNVQDDLMIITGTARIKGATVHSHHDHRIAMACAVAALKADGVTTIEAADAVNKSYPAFYEDLKMLGANVSLG